MAARSPLALLALWLPLALPLGLPAAAAAETITGVCPDGSIFLVQTERAIPCRGAKRIAPDEVPPLRPEYLPRPYTWQVYNEGQDPNNAYNMVDAARQVRSLKNRPPSAGSAPAPGTPAVSAAPPAGRPPLGPRDLGLSDGELRDLFLIVELSQDRAPAAFSKEGADGRERLNVSLAHSSAFARRFEQSLGVAGSGAVLLFTTVARDADAFYANFTFSQGHLTFHPKADDPAQLGILQGHLGPQAPDSVALGYVALPDGIDLTRPLDVYWNDRRVEVVFRPPGS